MRGVIASRSDARIVDIAHDLPRHDIRAAAFWLRFVLPEFPPAVHCIVVDPGVGTDRAALAIRAGDHTLIGPDNGVLRPPARALADGDPELFEITGIAPPSSTFHGRDVFAPAAALAHETPAFEDAHRFERTDGAVQFRFPDPSLHDDRVEGEVLVVDDFGNAITNVPGSFLEDRTGSQVRVEGPTATQDVPVVETFAGVDPGERLVTIGSHGYVECDVNRGRGDDAFELSPGDPVMLQIV